MNKAKRYLLLVLIGFSSFSCKAQVTISLRSSFIDSMKDRITFLGKFDLVADAKELSDDDGSLIVSGTQPVISLPIVTKLINAKSAKDAVSFIHFNAGTDKPVVLSGVWRIWTIHAGRTKNSDNGDWDPKKQTQGATYKFKTENPPHVFEINPILQIGGIDCRNTLKKINTDYYPAEKAFDAYSKATCTITNYDTRIIIKLSTPDIIYTDFWLKPVNEGTEITPDGRFVTCDVYNGEHGSIIAYNIRIGFVKGSDAETGIMNLGTYDKLHVLGMPRINLHDVAKNAEGNDAEPTEQPLPYEMIAIAPL